MDTSISKKLNAVSLICLMVGMLVTAQALTPQEKNTFMTLANSGITGRYVPLTTLATQFKAQATALKSWANELHANGGDQNIQAFVNAHKTQFLSVVSLATLQKHYNAAVAAGYQGDINDYAKPIRGTTITQRQAALKLMNQIGLYKMMLQVSQIFLDASAEASRLAKERHGGPRLVTTAYHPVVFFNLPVDACNELAVGVGLFAYSGLLMAETGIGLAFGIIAIGIGVAKDIYC